MRKVIFTIIIISLIIIIPNSAFAEVDGDFGYELIENTVNCRVTEYLGKDKNIIIPNSIEGLTVTEIGRNAFMDNEVIESVYIPSGVTVISKWAFCGCSNLKTVNIPYGVANIYMGAFYSCSSLEKVALPESVKIISDIVFKNCSGLRDITLPNSIEFIGGNVFMQCENLTSVKFDEGTKSIGSGMFRYCDLLNSVIVPDSVENIGAGAFVGCSSLETIIFSNDNQNFCVDDGVIFDKDKNTLVHYLGGNDRTSYSIPNGVTIIANSAFEDCGNLVSVTIPDTVKSIGDSAFERCTSLCEINIPNSANELLRYSFAYCSSLQSAVVGSGVTDIDIGVFENCTSLINVELSDNLEQISDRVFDKCSSLKKIVIPEKVNNMKWGIFNGCHSLSEIIILNDKPSDEENSLSIYCLFDEVSDGFEIVGYIGSAIEKYANENNYTFIDIKKTIPYTINYCKDDEVEESDVYYWENTFSLNNGINFAKNGYIIDGWDIEGAIYKLGALYTMPEKDVTARAVWIKDSDNDGISDDDEKEAGSDPNDVDDKPQTGYFEITLLDSDDNPLSGYEVVLNSKPQTRTTDENGSVVFANVSLSPHTLSIRNNDVQLATYSLNFTRGSANSTAITNGGTELDSIVSDNFLGLNFEIKNINGSWDITNYNLLERPNPVKNPKTGYFSILD